MESDIVQLDGNTSFLSDISESESQIPVHISTHRKSVRLPCEMRKPVRRTIKRNNLVLESMNLPVIMNINPRSIYNKSDEFSLLLDQYSADLICMSESWERENMTLDQLLKLDNYEIISNVKQREFKGGKPAILVNTTKYMVKRICPDPITVPVGVEAVWCLVTPKGATSNKFKHIAVCSMYYRGPKSTKKKELFDHIAETYHYLSAKYGSNIQYVIAGDTNRLNLAPILSLSHSLVQVVKLPTRLSPDRVLDPIITTMAKYYEEPVTMPPINPNINSGGKPSDHLVVLMRPISATYAIPPRIYKTVTTRPITDTGIQSFGQWIESFRWVKMYESTNAHKKAEIFQDILMENFERCFPLKTVKFSDDDSPWVTKSLKKIDRLRKREFYKNKMSAKWEKLNQAFLIKSEEEKENYYANVVADLKTSNISQWYSKVKRMSGQTDSMSEVTVDDLIGLSDQDQAEKIADHYASVSQLYEPVKKEDFPEYSVPSTFSPPRVTASKVEKTIKSMNKKSAGVPGDLPMKLIAEFGYEIAKPLAHLINCCFEQGIYPKLWKIEYVTPVPKVFPPETISDLRKISGLINLSKISDKIIAEYISEDMRYTRDSSQYGNQKKVSIQHYLVKMVHQILTSVDQNSNSKSFAVIMEMIDWKQAFDRQSHKLGIQSFIDNGVRPSLIPILLNFFQDREMKVKWRGLLSKSRSLPGGGPQGGTLGIEEYLSQSNNNTDFLSLDEKFKFIDDLSILEVLNLITIGLSSYNFHQHVASDVGISQSYLDPSNIKSQSYLDNLVDWTNDKEMKLNAEKTKYMIFNYSKKYQFNTRLVMEGKVLDQVHETRLLGLTIRDDLSWKANTENLSKRAYKRMIIIKNLFPFNVPTVDLIEIYILYIRSILEQSAVVWHSSLTVGEQLDLERVQKVALRLILKDDYTSYSEALELTGLDSLKTRRKKLCLNFAKKCVKNEATSDIFPLNPSNVDTRQPEMYNVVHARTDRLAKSAIPYMARLLNANLK